MGASSVDNAILVGGCENPVAADYAAHCARRGRRTISVTKTGRINGLAGFHQIDESTTNKASPSSCSGSVNHVVVFINARVGVREQAALAAMIKIAKEKLAQRYCIVSSFEVHLGNPHALRAENYVRRLLEGTRAQVIVLRSGHIITPHSRLGSWLQKFWLGFPFVPARLCSCCVDADDLFVTIDHVLEDVDPHQRRTYALLGTRKPWRDRLLENHIGLGSRLYAVIAPFCIPLTIFRAILGMAFAYFAGKSRFLQAWHVQTLFPRSNKEALTLYNKYNYKHVKIVGYNNGAIHFGQKYPGKTIVSMVRCNQRATVRGESAAFDAGVTIHQARDVLDKNGRELLVLPNYSYVALGTGYFIPIHGSASDFTTIAETIQKVLVYDPLQDRFISARREDPLFGEYLYNLQANVLLLRLQVRTKHKTRYSVKQLQSNQPTGKEIIGYFDDPAPSNVEIRKAGSAAKTIKVYQYFKEQAEGNGAGLDVPRDALGQLWDRLEENAFSSVLFHGLNRLLAYHVELFLTKEDFLTFWATHWDLPILKIQLRYIKKDGFKNSPFCQHDCVSADLFMLKKHRRRFDMYLRGVIPTAKLNPGKHTH
jgi:hypothetical protein